MSEVSIQVDLGTVDYDSLKTDEDFVREAQSRLPKAMEAMGNLIGEQMWSGIQKAFGTKTSEKAKFIRTAKENYMKDSAQKKRMKDFIVGRLKDGKAKQSKK